MPDNENKLATIEPETREETFLQDIADGTQTLTPAVRKEEFLRRIAAKPGVPSVTESDEGKVLTVDNGEAVWGEASSLPEITAQDEGKVLTVDNGEAVWGEASSLPEITAQDEGKVLTVDNGEAVWGEGGGGDLFEIVYSPASLTGVSSSNAGIIIVLSDAPAPVYDGPFYAWSVEGVAAQIGGMTLNYLPGEIWMNAGQSIHLTSVETGDEISVKLEVNNNDIFQLSSPVYSDGITATVTGIRIAKSKDDRVEQIKKSSQIQSYIPE